MNSPSDSSPRGQSDPELAPPTPAPKAGTSINLDAMYANSQVEYPVWDSKGQKICWIVVGLMALALVYSYWNTLVRIAGFWEQPQYSHAGLMPIIAGVLLWLRREAWRQVPASHRYIGLGILALGIAMRVFGAVKTQYFLDDYSLLVCGVGIFVMVGGLPAMRWSAPAVLFLFFMMPIPKVRTLTVPLQEVSSAFSHFFLVILGVDAFRDGTQIFFGLSQEAMNVAEQCSGLRMLTIFLGLAVALAILSRNRPWWERALIVVSAFPIAVIANVFRITLTGLLFSFNIDSPLLNTIFHDWPGFIMMPVAIGLLYLVFAILSNLVIDDEEKRVAPVALK